MCVYKYVCDRPGSDKSRGLGWAVKDLPKPWSAVRVPVLLIMRDDFDKILHTAGITAASLQSVDMKKDEL